MRPILALSALLLAVWASTAAARSYTVEDLLATESFGRVVIDPSERWLVIEHRRPWKQAARYDYSLHTPMMLSRLEVVDLKAPGRAKPLFDQSPDAGYTAGPISPGGAHMLVYRLAERSFEAGLVTLASRQVRWLGITPELPVYGRAAQWRSPTELLLIARADGDMPRQLALGWEAKARLGQLWATTASGQAPSSTSLGSGRFVGVRPEAQPARLLRIDVESGAVTALAEGDFIDLQLSPSGRYAALIANGGELQPKASDRVYVALPSRRRELVMVDLRTNALTRPCTGCDIGLGLLTWSPRADELLALQRRPEQTWDALDLLRINPATGVVQRPMPADLQPSLAFTGEGAPSARADWLGPDPIIFARPRLAKAARADWYRLAKAGPVNLTGGLAAPPRELLALSRDHLVLSADHSVWRIDKGARVRQMDRSPGLQVAKPADEAGARGRENPRLPICLPPETRAAPAEAEPLAVSGRHTVVLMPGAGGAKWLALVTDDGDVLTLLDINQPLADVTPAKVAAVHHAGPRGEALTSWLYLPAGAKPSERAPLVVIPYRGMSYPVPAKRLNVGEFTAFTNVQILVGQGYGVLTPSLPYDEAGGEPTAGVADQILSVVDAAIAQGGLDPERVALFGHSFGALTAVAAASQSSRFKSVIAHAGVHDEISSWGILPTHQWVVPEDGYAVNFTTGNVERGQAQMMAPPWKHPDRYIRNSNIFAADKITAPVLLIHGDADELRINQAQEMFSALYRQGKDAVFVTYWGEGHSMASPANITDMYAKIIDWLAVTMPSAGPRSPPSGPPTPPSSPRP